MSQKIYDQHQAAFLNVSAYVILGKETDQYGDARQVAKIAFKFPKDGAGRLYAYVHFHGVPMVRGHANGYGYDKKSAAVEHAAASIEEYGINDAYGNEKERARRSVASSDAPRSKEHAECEAFKAALRDIGGSDWKRKLENAGFTVLQAV